MPDFYVIQKWLQLFVGGASLIVLIYGFSCWVVEMRKGPS